MRDQHRPRMRLLTVLPGGRPRPGRPEATQELPQPERRGRLARRDSRRRPTPHRDRTDIGHVPRIRRPMARRRPHRHQPDPRPLGLQAVDRPLLQQAHPTDLPGDRSGATLGNRAAGHAGRRKPAHGLGAIGVEREKHIRSGPEGLRASGPRTIDRDQPDDWTGAEGVGRPPGLGRQARTCRQGAPGAL